MLYHLFDWLTNHWAISKFPGSSLFQFTTFRVLLAMILSLVITTVFGKKLIKFLQRKQLGESVRELGLAGEKEKGGTPTMGGIIIILAILIPTLLLANLDKVYIRLMMLCTVWLGTIGFIDDYLKLRAKRIAKEKGIVYKKSDSDGLAGRFKIFGQVMLGVIVGCTLYFTKSVVVEREIYNSNVQFVKDSVLKGGEKLMSDSFHIVTIDGKEHLFAIVKTPITTIPFCKNS